MEKNGQNYLKKGIYACIFHSLLTFIKSLLSTFHGPRSQKYKKKNKHCMVSGQRKMDRGVQQPVHKVREIIQFLNNSIAQ